MPKVPYPYEVNGKLVTGNGSLNLNTNLFLIKRFLIAKFDCIANNLFCSFCRSRRIDGATKVWSIIIHWSTLFSIKILFICFGYIWNLKTMLLNSMIWCLGPKQKINHRVKVFSYSFLYFCKVIFWKNFWRKMVKLKYLFGCGICSPGVLEFPCPIYY